MSRGLGKVERKILQGLKKYEEYWKEEGCDRWTGTWSLSHYIEGNCEEIFLDNKPDEVVEKKYIGGRLVPGKWVGGEWQMPGWTYDKIIEGYTIPTEFTHSTYIKTYNAIKSLERKGFVETKVETQSAFFNYNVTRFLGVRLKH